MPFLVLPKTQRVSDQLSSWLGSRLCPYTDLPRLVLEARDYSVWGSSVTRAETGALRNRLARGTADFEVRVEGTALVISTDPLGTCPIWYRELGGLWVVSPEAKAIAAVAPVVLRPEVELLAPGPRAAGWSPYEDVLRLPPGCALRLDGRQALVEGAPRSFDLPRGVQQERTDWSEPLAQALLGAFTPGPQATGSFISGGIDSSLACALARRHGAVATYSLGTCHGDEFPQARELARHLACTHHEVRLERSEVLESLDRLIFQNELFDGLAAEITLQLSALYAAAQGTCERVVTGYGSDLLFDGMLRSPAYMQAVGLQTTAELIERTRWTGELSPFVHWARGIAVEHVFLNPALIEVALQVPRDLCFVDGVEKHILRETAVGAGLLPRDLAFRKKLGLSDGTGTNRLFSEALEIEGLHGYAEKSQRCAARLAALATPMVGR